VGGVLWGFLLCGRRVVFWVGDFVWFCGGVGGGWVGGLVWWGGWGVSSAKNQGRVHSDSHENSYETYPNAKGICCTVEDTEEIDAIGR